MLSNTSKRLLGVAAACFALSTASFVATGAMALEDCDNPAVSSNGKYQVTLVGGAPERDGDLVKFTYEVCKLTNEGGNTDPALSHWVMSLDLPCVGEEFGLDDFVVDCEIVDAVGDEDCQVGLDPTTGYTGIKWNVGVDYDTCRTVSVTFDESVLVDGQSIGVGPVPAAFKGGNIDNSFADVCGPVCIDTPDDFEGFTPGYWKNHPESWQCYTTETSVSTVFGAADYSGLGGNSLMQALNFKGGSTLAGAKQILLRAAVAAILNACHANVNYPWDQDKIIEEVVNALNSNDRNVILDLATILDEMNNAGGDIDN